MNYRVFRIEEVEWSSMPGHYDAFCKYLVNNDSGSKYVDFRISIYRPKGYAEVHIHDEAENIFYIMQGTGIFELDGERFVVDPGTVVFIPPGVKHGVHNTGCENMLCLVVAAPPADMPR